ncbi:MAG: hypothetical protein J6U39_01980 [Clostridia bacterium]|nr:hypothetical protein [Clostridia bacterium]
MRILKKLRKKVRGVIRQLKSKFDALGSYTGSPEENGSKPEQDADDL